MKELTAGEYMASPLSQQEIDQYRDSQKRWVREEKACSIAFLALINMPLVYLAMTSSWTTILIGVGLVTVLYTFFKIYLTGTLDSKYPCRIVIDGFPFVSPQDIKSLQEGDFENPGAPDDFLNKVRALNRPMLNFEKSLLDSMENKS
jgi:hypothetical protein